MDLDPALLWQLVPPKFQPYIGLVGTLVTLASFISDRLKNQNNLFTKAVHAAALNWSKIAPKSPVQPVPPPK